MDWLDYNLSVALELKLRFVCEQRPALEAAAGLLFKTLARNGRILICGNGGSASDSCHFAGELVGRFLTDRQPFSAYSLASDPATLTAIANDFGYEEVFARQVLAHGRPQDVLVAISTSGRSPNVVKAAEAASSIDMKVVALVGRLECPLAHASNIVLAADNREGTSVNSARIQEVHIFAIHSLCELIDRFDGDT